MEEKYCQGCNSKLTPSNVLKTKFKKDNKSIFCVYCYLEGTFTNKNTELNERLYYERFANELNNQQNHLTKDESVVRINAYFPKLERWFFN